MSQEVTGKLTPCTELEKNWRHVVRVWWAIIWRLMLMQLAFAACVVVATETFLEDYPYLREAINTLSLLAIFPFGIWALYCVINKNFGAFRLSFILPASAGLEEVEAQTAKARTAQQEKKDKN